VPNFVDVGFPSACCKGPPTSKSVRAYLGQSFVRWHVIYSCGQTPRPPATQIFNIKRACGHAGVAGAVQLTATTSSARLSDPGATGDLFVVLGGRTYLIISNPAAEAAPLVATAFRNATFTPPSPFSATSATSWSLNVPCADLPDLASVPLAFVYQGTDDFALDNVSIQACLIETCGGQYVFCDTQSLSSTKPCTPGFDCDTANCCF
jgi:hypothetical protein